MKIKITESLAARLVELELCAADANEEAQSEATKTALLDGKLTLEEYVELTKEPEAEEANQLKTSLETIMDRLEAIEKREPSDLSKLFAQAQGVEETEGDEGKVRVVGAHERYDKAKTASRYPEFTRQGSRHPRAGMRVREMTHEGGIRYIDEPSQLDQAVNGAWFKYQLHREYGGRPPVWARLTDHDLELVKYAVKNLEWGGVINGDGAEVHGAIGVNNRKLSDWEQKQLLDDTTSGGLEIAPIVFDDAIILTPYLYGELFPLVNVVTITRGRRIEGATMGQITWSSGQADATPITLFNTANFVTAFDTTIYGAAGCIEIGLDFLSDSPVDVAGLITTMYGEGLLNWLDEQIAVGDGTTEPEGVTVATGTVAVASDNGNVGPPTVGDYESLLFGVLKQFRGTDRNRAAFAANETTYSRARGIAVGASDARRVFGMTHEDYMLLGHSYKICGNFANTQVVFGNFNRYRMYRRLGLTTKVTTEGRTLVRANEMLISARARFGGQIEDGNAFAVTTDAQS
jgi:HK97 family phage major capsid protein